MLKHNVCLQDDDYVQKAYESLFSPAYQAYTKDYGTLNREMAEKYKGAVATQRPSVPPVGSTLDKDVVKD